MPDSYAEDGIRQFLDTKRPRVLGQALNGGDNFSVFSFGDLVQFALNAPTGV